MRIKSKYEKDVEINPTDFLVTIAKDEEQLLKNDKKHYSFQKIIKIVYFIDQLCSVNRRFFFFLFVNKKPSKILNIGHCYILKF